MAVPQIASSLSIPSRWDEVTPAWMTAALAAYHPGAVVSDVSLLLRDDGTNRRARLGVEYAAGSGPATVFAKAESDAPGRREIHARNGNLFNEPRLFASGAELPLEHPLVYGVGIDEPGLDYVVVMEDLVARGADPRDATRPLTVDEAARGLRGLARLHRRYWDRVDDDRALDWVEPFLPVDGWRAPLSAGTVKGIERAGEAIPRDLQQLTGDELVGDAWVRYITTLTKGPQTLLHGDAHIGNTYLLPDGQIGFLDWQVVRSGNWSHDVGYFIQSALTEDDRRANESALVEEYRAALDVASARPTPAEAWLRYCATPAHGLPTWLVTLLSSVHHHEVSLTLVRRFAAAFVELDTRSALDELGG